MKRLDIDSDEIDELDDILIDYYSSDEERQNSNDEDEDDEYKDEDGKDSNDDVRYCNKHICMSYSSFILL